ncbi:polymorphic toxin-type HINT domain-containing protein [Streptomyces sp. NPDC048410]|uniref:polymorphic toxin-type HINT domain-containing protein n=1 Tax=Streptomyces sp. NPDC048410 TaxID=3365545 RepID=UPI003720C893
MAFGIGTSSRSGGGATRRRTRRLLVQSLTLALVVPLGLAQVAEAKGQGGLGRPDVAKSRASKVKAFDGPGAKRARQKVAYDRNANLGQSEQARMERNSAWPKPGQAALSLIAGKVAGVTPGGLPIRLSRKSAKTEAEARVTVLDQKAAQKLGVTGVVLTAEADTSAATELSVDYSSFASAVGGDWSHRLRLVRLPACALTTPRKAACREQTPLASDNDLRHHTVSAKVPVAETSTGLSSQLMGSGNGAAKGATVLALTAAATGGGSGPSPAGTGNYSATPLSASSSWQAGGGSGSFTWSYGFTMPPAAAGPTAPLSLSYDSGSIDGRTATSNNQGTSVGEGFALTESYVERTYGSCDDDGHDETYDLCWKYDNARLVLNGKSTRLVKDDSSGQWRLEGDDASKVTRGTGADNGDDNGEYWTVTTGDGTKYVFGLDKLEGANTQRTNSTWTVPVFGDDSGEPGYTGGTSFGDRSLNQAWRWNLDYVEDLSGNAAVNWYTKELNYYKKNKSTTASASYTRGGYLLRSEYGLRKDALFTDKADAKVTFDYAERCTASDCSSLTKDTADNWPDVPFDAICSKDDSECHAEGPAFFTRKRLTNVDTSSYNATSSGYDAVDSWTLTQQFLDGGDIGDSSDQVLTLKSLTRTAKAGDTSIKLDPISFTYQMRPNRVDGTDDILPLTRPRISTVTSETGAITTVTLSSTECVRSQVLSAAPDTNTRSCYPQYWHINGAENAAVDWFHKYRVLAVTVSDPASNNQAIEYAYSYSGAAWHHSDEPFTPKDERTWSDWRGYSQVTLLTGATSVTRSKTVSLYLQGMNGDKNKDGTTKSVTVAPLSSPALGAASLADSDQYAGQLREQVTYDGAMAISATVNDPWSQETARQSVPDAGDRVARYVRTSKVHDYTYLTVPKAWRERQTNTTFDSYGMPATVDDYGQVGKASDETCTRTWYARNSTLGITSLVSRTRTVAAQCSTADTSLSLPTGIATRGDVLSDVAAVYDTANATSWTAAQQPSKGRPTWSGRPTGYPAGADANGDRLPTGWQTTTTKSYDTLGRPLSVTDNAGNTTSTAYTPTDAGPLTRTITTDPKLFKTVSFIDPRRGLALRNYDVNTKKTELNFDALGRLTDVWLPDRIRGSQAPNTSYAYHMESTKPSWVSTSTLKKDGATYNTTYALYDALLRPLQTQSPTPQGGRLLTDTRYDTRGLAYQTYADIFDSRNAPNSTYSRAEYGGTPAQTETVFDGTGRATSTDLYVYGVKKWSTSTSYTGDSVATTALAGGSATRVITDVRGQTVETREYAGVSPADTEYGTGPGASYAYTKFSYALDGQKASITGPDNAKWTYTYDLYGRQVSGSDPDRGTTATEYNGLDQVTKSTDSRNTSVLSDYDVLGRPTGTWVGSKTDANQLTGYAYDSVLKGLPASSTRYVGGKAGLAYTSSVTAYDSLSRPSSTQLQLPAGDPFVQAGTPPTLSFETNYNVDGTLNTTKEPAAGSLPSEIIDYGYDGLGNLTSFGGATGYLLNTAYTALTQPQQLTLGTGGSGNKSLFVTNTYEEGTGRLTRSHVTDQTHPYTLQDLNYGYDQTGNVTSITDATTLGGTGSADAQCFAYDGYQRLAEAWTPAPQKCADPRSSTSLSGPAPYWSSYTYNNAGQRTSETVHQSSGDKKTTYCYTNTQQPHTLTGTSTKADCTNPERAYDYDKTGNTGHRPGATATQALTWSAEGKLSKLTENAKSTDYIYSAEGTLLIRATQTGERVLYAGATELHLRANGTVWAQRYYNGGGVTAAYRTNESGTNKLTYLAGDHHGTSSLAIGSDTSQAITKRYTNPFGADRGTPLYGPWPNDKGFLGKTRDITTGLTHVEAREYDPGIGQFISVDPVLSTDQPFSLNGYSYANNSPVTESDPSGLESCYPNYCSGDNGTYEEYKPSADPASPSYDGGTGRANSGTVSSSDSGAVSTSATELVSLLPRNMGPDQLKQNWVAYGYGTSGGGYWDAAVGDGDRTAMLCFGRTACQKAATLYMNTGDLARAKLVAATYCIEHRKRCGIDQGSFESMKDAAETVPMAIAIVGEAAAALRAIRRVNSLCHSFVTGTEVQLADGSTRPIEKIKVGDEVTATDPATGKTSMHLVVDTIVTKHDKKFVELTVAESGGDGSTGSLTATTTHPFWSPSLNDWVDAGDLRKGMLLREPDGRTVEIASIRHYVRQQVTYDLTVGDVHTYYVLAGATPVLVHNSNGCVNWASNSVKTWGHTFKTHGAGAKNTKALTDRARSTNNQQGQWLDNDAAAEFLKGLHVEGAGPRSVRIPDGLGQVIMPDGSIVQARAATIIPSPNGLYKTGFPIIGPN